MLVVPPAPEALPKLSDDIGRRVHRVVFSVPWAVLIIALTVLGLVATPSPWLVMLTIINIYQLWILTPLGWGDRYNDQKLEKIIYLLEHSHDATRTHGYNQQ